MSAFASIVTAPPGGKWFWEDGEVLFESASYNEVVDRIRQYFLEKGIAKDASVALAEFMCPRMPRGFCRGFSGEIHKTAGELMDATRAFSTLPLETMDVVQRRLEVCSKCPKCDHSICVTCRGIDKKVYDMFEGRRVRLPADRASGVCTCAGAFAMVVASVHYNEPPASEGIPATCWRNEK